MNHASHNKMVSFIWSIADDCLRDVYKRGKYRDVILPMVVLRRIDTLLEDTKEAVLEEIELQKTEVGLNEPDALALRKASGYVFYNTSKWTLQSLYSTATNNNEILVQNFEEYINGFSGNVKEIIEKFDMKAKIKHMARKDVLLAVLEKFISPRINLTPHVREDPDGNKLPALTNLGMGYVFEELIRKFNEENNEEAGEYFTPRDVIQLMIHLVFDPVKDNLASVMTIYDPACGSGGMLTESQNFIKDEDGAIKAKGDIYLYGKEINDETYAICKSDMMIKGNDPQNIKSGCTLSGDEFFDMKFDFMLSNPPYGKSWSSERKYIKDDKNVIDLRFTVCLQDYWGNEDTVDATPRSSDGQLLFLLEMISKMKPAKGQAPGSRIASVHNGSSLFTGDAGGGESNIRRHIIENDMLEAIVQMPESLFYNTGITTYIWLISNNKPVHRKGKVQLIDASLLFRKLRKNLGDKNCEFAPEHIKEIAQTHLEFAQKDRNTGEEGIAAKIFDNKDFGYFKVTIERPDRRKAQFTAERIETLRFDKAIKEPMAYAYGQWGNALYSGTTLQEHGKEILKWCEENGIVLSTKNRAKLLKMDTWKKQEYLFSAANILMEEIGHDEHTDFNKFKKLVDKTMKSKDIRLNVSEKNALLNAVSWYDQTAEKVIHKQQKLSGDKLMNLLAHLDCKRDDLPDFGFYPTGNPDEYVTYEPSSDLRDNENIPLKGNIHTYFLQEVKPYVDEAWIDLDSVKIGYEINFNRYFYKYAPPRSIEEIDANLKTLEADISKLLKEVLACPHDLDSNALVKEDEDKGITFLRQFAAQYSWEQVPTKRKFQYKKKINQGMQENRRLALTLGGVIDRALDDDAGLQTSDYSTYQIFEKNDLVFKLIDLENIRTSRVGHVPHRGIMSPAYIRLSALAEDTCSRYYYWLFYSAYINNIFNGMGGGVRQNLTPTDLLEFPIPLPDINTQEAIANFLNEKTTQIDQVIDMLLQLIHELKGYKSSLISSVVTGQINVTKKRKHG